jgi:CheY-like chemotaxis protein
MDNPTPRVLVVDDNPMNGRLAHVILTRAGYDATVVDSAPRALEYLAANEVDTVLSDVSMPGMNGNDLCREVRRLHPSGRPRMVAYTALALDFQRTEILASGFDALLVKPANAEAIVAAVNPRRSQP